MLKQKSIHGPCESTTKTTTQFFMTKSIAWGWALSKKTVFFSLNPIYGGSDGGFLKYVIPLN